MTVLTRFAPSPTGLLHVGNARTALLNWLFARARGGDFILRLDDTDRDRCREEFVVAIRDDLAWLGQTWAEEFRQSARLDLYHDAFRRLHESGRVYACYETPEELDFKRNRQRARGLPPLYDRAALTLTDADRAAFEAEGRRPHYRFLLEAGEVAWTDLVRGAVSIRAETISDPVIRRADESYLYMLPSTVDDIDLGISHVIRGEDHVTNTAVQIQMFEALGSRAPAFGHVPLLAGKEGEGLSKRLGSLTVRSLREEGLEPIALDAYLAQLGTGATELSATDLDMLAARFDLAAYARATPKFDTDQLRRLNKDLLQTLPFEAVADRLQASGLEAAGPAFWQAVRPNLDVLADAEPWYRVCYGEIEPVIEDPGFAAQAAAHLPPEPWSEETWGAWTGAVKAATGRKGKALFKPLRLALTGRETGPELRALLPLIGRARAQARLTGEEGTTGR